MEELRVDENLAQKRLDVVLASHEKVSSRSEAQKIIKSGEVQINDSSKKINPKRLVQKGDIITFSLLPPPVTDLIPVKKELDIIYEDPFILVVNKPRGMVVHPAAGHYDDTLVNYLLYYTQLSNVDETRPGIVHRIDKDTSGLIVVAKDRKSHENLAKQFFEHTIERKYCALVWGTAKQSSGKIDEPIGRHPVDRKRFAIRPSGKHAVTHWKTLESFQYLSLFECRLETGRTHQIRVHLTSIGHPLLGDMVYGRFRNFGKKIPADITKKLKEFPGQALHAKSLGFNHPDSGDWIEFDSNISVEIDELINVLRETFSS